MSSSKPSWMVTDLACALPVSRSFKRHPLTVCGAVDESGVFGGEGRDGGGFHKRELPMLHRCLLEVFGGGRRRKGWRDLSSNPGVEEIVKSIFTNFAGTVRQSLLFSSYSRPLVRSYVSSLGLLVFRYASFFFLFLMCPHNKTGAKTPPNFIWAV